MTAIRYEGTSDVRILDKDDMKKYVNDPDFSKTTFKKGEVNEVDDQVAEVLLSHEHFAGEFVEHQDSDEPELANTGASEGAADGDDDQRIADAANNSAAADSGHTGESTGSPGGTTATPTTTPTARASRGRAAGGTTRST